MNMTQSSTCTAQLKNFIGGKFFFPLTGKHLDNVNPYTATVINRVPASGAEDIRQAINAASDAFPGWSSVSVPERAEYLRRLASEIEKEKVCM